jgi:hypothetical protein
MRRTAITVGDRAVKRVICPTGPGLGALRYNVPMSVENMHAHVSGTDPAHSLYSRLRERIVEHVFIGEALRALWRRGVFDVEVLRGETDAHEYDLVMVRGAIVRHIQFKTGVRSKPGRVKIASALTDKQSGCVIWIQVNNDLAMKAFWWLGAGPMESLPDLGDRRDRRIARTKDGTRPAREAHRLVNGSRFRKFSTLDEVLEALFGRLPAGRPPNLPDSEDVT